MSKRNSYIAIFFLITFPIFGRAQQLEVSRDTLIIEKQKEGFILGLEEIKIVINKVQYNIQDKLFLITGYIDNYKNDSEISMVDVDLIRGTTIIKKYYSTKQYGYFEIKMRLKDKLTFYGGVYEGYISIKQPLKKMIRQ